MTKIRYRTGILLGALLCSQMTYAQTDSDMDGVPDTIDQCPNTPFLAEVDQQGCLTKLLYFPQERDTGNLDVLMGYNYTFNEEDINQDVQHSLTLKANYVYNDWIYSVRTGKFIEAESSEGMIDTTFTVTKRFRPYPNLKYLLGVSIRLPTYDFAGNKTDLSLRGSVVYYPESGLSLFAGAHFTLIGDQTIDDPIRDAGGGYAGIGYFFDKVLYLNASYNYRTSKYVSNHDIQTLSTTLFYEISPSWYTSLSYAYQVNDDDLHETFIWQIGYRVW